MRHVVYKFFTIGAYEKEEKWLNEMSARGLQLIAANGIRMEFEEGGRGEYVYRLELLPHLPSHPESVMYLRFLEETGVEQVASYHRWVYLRRKAGEGAFEVYSDLESKIAHCGRIIGISTGVSAALLVTIATQLIAAFIRYAESVQSGAYMAYMPYILPFTVPALVLLIAALAFVQIVVIPVRKTRKKLIAKKRVSE